MDRLESALVVPSGREKEVEIFPEGKGDSGDILW
jgi:hypothetical protein